MSSPATARDFGRHEAQGFFASAGKQTFILCLLLFAVTIAIYDSVSRHPFVNYDDDRYVTNNAHINAGITREAIHWAFTAFYEAIWQPLTWISHALDCQFFGMNPAGHHYTSLLIHALNAVLIFWLLQAATGFTWRSLTVAALFALHPLNVEAVAWVAERKTVLSMFFFLLALAAYGFYVRKPGAGRYALVAAAFACALMSKPMAVTLPAALLLCDFWPLGRTRLYARTGEDARPSIGRLVLEKLPLLAISAASAVFTVLSARAGSALSTAKAVPFGLRLQNAIVSYATYLWKAFWPVRLAPMYPHPGSLPLWQVAGALALLLVLTAAVLKARSKPYLAIGWFWFLGTLVPMIGVVQVGAIGMADRYAYLSFLGLFVIVTWGVADWARERAIGAKWLAAPVVAALALLAGVTRHQLGYWADNVALWSHTVEVTKDNFVAEDNLGGSLIALGRIDEAMVHFQAANRINPGDAVANLNFATKAQQDGNPQRAVELYRVALKTTVDPVLQATAYSNQGAAYLSLRDYANAKSSYQAALELEPNRPHALVGIGLVELRMGENGKAVAYLAHAMDVQPTDVGFVLLSRALAAAGRPLESQAALQQAQQISPDLSQAQQAAERLLAQ